MNPSANFKRIELQVRRNRIRAAWITTLLAASAISHAMAQGLSKYVPVSAACLELNQTVMTQIANGKLKGGELAVSAVLASGDDRALDSCAGLVLHNMAVVLLVSGGIADAERLAERSVVILEKTYPPNDVVLLHPLQILVAARFEQGKTARAKETFKKMQSIQVQRPEDSALVHGTTALLLAAEGRRSEAEAEYLAAIRALQEAGRGETADMGATLNDLGSLYIKQQRLTEARQALDRALAIFSRAQEAVPMDRIKLLHVRGVLQARQGDWQGAEKDLHDALWMADREPSGTFYQ